MCSKNQSELNKPLKHSFCNLFYFLPLFSDPHPQIIHITFSPSSPLARTQREMKWKRVLFTSAVWLLTLCLWDTVIAVEHQMPLSPVIVLVCCGLSVLMLGWLCACLKVKTFWMQICFYHLNGSFFSFLNIFYINFLCLWSRFRLVSPQFESLPPNPTPSFPFSLPWFCVDPSDVSSCLGSSPPDESSMVKIRVDCVGLVLLIRIVFIEQKWAESACDVLRVW